MKSSRQILWRSTATFAADWRKPAVSQIPRYALAVAMLRSARGLA